MGLYRLQGAENMDNEGKIVSFRMELEDLQTMDDYLAAHPELGGRSLFIRTAVRAFIDRDADVKTQATNDSAVTVRFAGAEKAVLRDMVDKGVYIDTEDAVRTMVRESMLDKTYIKEVMHSVYQLETSELQK